MTRTRNGIALVWALVVLSVLGTMSTLAMREFASVRRLLTMRETRIQAVWLARSGAEIAVAKLLTDPDYKGETLEPFPGGVVKIAVEKDAAKPGNYRIRCEARSPIDDDRVAKFSLTRRAIRARDGGKTTLMLTSDE